ncbi:MAG: peptide deformylase [Clostridia bacterium]|nr:peptide deformylase [Clostridia bacterium]MDR3643672.1 peptide deformylase [Clostridia bacterium]
MAIRNICLIGDEVLRKKSRPVAEIDARVVSLLDDMAETLHASNGVGLAAPQVGVLRRCVVIDMGTGLMKLVNPEIIDSQGEHIVEEGCLSIPNRRGSVKRPEQVTVRTLDEKGVERLIDAQGELAKCLCHEIDHLDGILFIDRAVKVQEG